MTGLKLFFESNQGDLKIENGQFVVADDLNTLVLTSEFSDARAEPEDPKDILNIKTKGYWGEELMAINARRWGSKYWLYRRVILNTDAVNGINDTAKACVQHLRDNGIVETITVKTERQGVARIGQQITYQEPNAEEPTRVIFRNLWDVIRAQL